jgi:hypothetical protein
MYHISTVAAAAAMHARTLSDLFSVRKQVYLCTMANACAAVGLSCRHLSFLATSLGQLQDQERGISTHDDLPLPDATPSTDTDSAPLSTAPSTSSSNAASHIQQQEVQAASEVLRMLVQEICNTVQLQGPAMNTAELANLVAAMARLGHYDWQMMRQVGTLVLRHTLVSVQTHFIQVG